MKTLVLIISILAVSDISACAATGLVRTQLEKWKIQEFNDIGLKVDLPVQPFGKWLFH